MGTAAGSRRRPWPYDVYIKDQRCILAPDKDGNLIGRKTKTLETTAPVTYEYGSASPFTERTTLFHELFGGMGLGVQPSRGPIRRYKYTEKADCSIDGKWMKGPRFEDHVETIPTTGSTAGAVRQLVTALHAGSEVVFALCDNGVYRRTADANWVASLTSGTSPALPGGQLPQQAVRFKARYTGAVDALYLGTDDGNIWRYADIGAGSVWLQAGALEGPGVAGVQGECRFVERVGDEFWAAGNNWVAKAEADPMLRASYAGVIYVGDQSTQISWLKQVDNTLYIWTRDGRIFTVTEDGEDLDLFPDFARKNNVVNGRNSRPWNKKMWSPVGDQLVRIDAEANMEFDGLGQLLDNTSPIQGRAVAFAPHHTWFMYEVYYDEIHDQSYLIKHGTWVGDPESDITNIQDRFIDVHHGPIYDWDKQATTAEVVQGVHATSNDRLYIGFSNGTVEWCVLPRTTPDPSKDAQCEFTALDSYVYFPNHHAQFQADNKLWQGMSVFGELLSSSEWVELQYRIFQDDATSYETLIGVNGEFKYQIHGERIDFPLEPALYSKIIDIRAKLLKDPDPAVSPLSFSPIVSGIGMHSSVRPAVALEYQMEINCSSFRAKRNGVIDRRRGSLLRNNLLQIASEIGNITITLPDGSEEEVAVIDYEEVWTPQNKRREIEMNLRMVFIQIRTISENLVQEGLTYGFLEDFTLGELEDII